MTKFVTVVMAVGFAVVFSAAALADGWKIGNWEPPAKAPVLKAVSLNADWGTTAVAPAAPASCRGMTQHVSSAPARCNGRGGRRFLGWRIAAILDARAQASEARAHVVMGSGHS